MKSRIAVLVKPGKFEIEEREVSVGYENEVVVKIAQCGLCRWELNHWQGILGTCPQTPGHEWSGTVHDKGPGVTEFEIGDPVTALPGAPGFTDYTKIGKNRLFKLDKGVNLLHAMGEPLKCIMTVLRSTRAEAGDTGVIAGCGPMGLWCVQGLSGHMLPRLIAVDIDDAKLALAKKYGATHTVNAAKEDAAKAISDITGGRFADFVIDGSGVPSLLIESVKYLKRSRGRLLIMSSYESICKEFDFREATSRSAEIISPHPSYSLDEAEDMRRTVMMLDNLTFHSEDIVTHVYKLEDIQKAFEDLESRVPGYIKGTVVP